MGRSIFRAVFPFHVHVDVNRVVLILQPTILVFKGPRRWSETPFFFRTVHPDVARIVIRRFRNVLLTRLTTRSRVWLFILISPHVGIPVVIGVLARKTRFVFLLLVSFLVSFQVVREQPLDLWPATVFVSNRSQNFLRFFSREPGLN